VQVESIDTTPSHGSLDGPEGVSRELASSLFLGNQSCRVFRACYRRQADGLEDGLAYFSLRFDGRQHSGVDDAINTAILLLKMLAQGCRMRLTSTILRPNPSLKRPAHSSDKMTVLEPPDAKRTQIVNVCGGTAPFCRCMRRSVARLCTTPGLNLGDTYYRCSQGKSGCEYFQWQSK
jgi:hypothetical protein